VLEIVKASPHRRDGDVASLLVSDAKETSLEVKVLAKARCSGDLKDLRCETREKMLAFLQQEYPACLPRRVPGSRRQQTGNARRDRCAGAPAGPHSAIAR
jgi:hypothetical protein